MKVLELFGGVGACTKALCNLGVDFEIVDYVEIDKFAVKSYNALYGKEFLCQDIRDWDKDIEVDLIMHGSPCQNFSRLGLQDGGDKDSGTKSSLMYETLRIVEKLRPKYVIWENVKHILSEKHHHNFQAYLDYMKELGYTSYYKCLNAKDFGVPQNRNRVFTVSILGSGNFDFPNGRKLDISLPDWLEEHPDEKYYLLPGMKNYIFSLSSKYRVNPPNVIFNRQIACSKTTKEGSTRADTSDYIIDNLDIHKEYSLNEVLKYDIQKLRIRRLSTRECWRLMGFTDEDYDKVSKVNSDFRLYIQAGNTIVVPVLEDILMELLNLEKS